MGASFPTTPSDGSPPGKTPRPSPTSQAWFLYDGEGHRVEQYTIGGSGNHTYYLPGNVEEVTPSNTLVKYYSAGGLALGENTTTSASGISYLADDGLGSVSEALNQTGTATGSMLYGPYGSVRYSSGTMPTSKGFTGQYADASTGLDYYGARYYDSSLGQFTSADTVTDGLNRYGYVKGNPETYSDPSGHRCFTGDGGVCGGPGGSPPPPPPDCHTTHTCTSKADEGKVPCSQDPQCMKHYDKWKNLIGLDAGAGWTTLIGDVYTLISEGGPMITELLALFAGDITVLGSLVMHLADVVFALSDLARTATQLLGAQPDGQLQGMIRGFEAVAGTLKLLADMGGAFFAFFNPLQAAEDWLSKAARPFIMKGAVSMLGFLGTHIGLSWLPQILSVGAEDFLSLTPDQAMEKYEWMRDIDLPTPFAGA